jgi:hypothetical protein
MLRTSRETYTNIKRPPVPIFMVVVTHDWETGTVEQTRIIDHGNKEEREWLNKHCYWAFRNGKAVTSVPIPDRDAPVPEWVMVD